MAVSVWLLLVNAWAVAQFAIDKRAAIAGTRRVPEANLLVIALLGGTAGAYAARALFRHKTRKQPFSFRLHLIATIQLGAAIGLSVAISPPA